MLCAYTHCVSLCPWNIAISPDWSNPSTLSCPELVTGTRLTSLLCCAVLLMDQICMSTKWIFPSGYCYTVMVSFPLFLCLVVAWRFSGDAIDNPHFLHPQLVTTGSVTSPLGHEQNEWLSHANSNVQIDSHNWLYCLWVLEICCFPGAFSLINSTGAQRQNANSCSDLTVMKIKQKCLINMLLLLSGTQPNPGLSVTFNTLADFQNMPVLHITHMNACSLLPKMDMMQIWAESTGAD